jgi:type I restriction-modification system DNA methylase subunit
MGHTNIAQKLWNYCNVLRDDGMSYDDYVEQLTYLLFLKVADDRTKPPYKQKSIVPKNYDWPSLIKKKVMSCLNITVMFWKIWELVRQASLAFLFNRRGDDLNHEINKT